MSLQTESEPSAASAGSNRLPTLAAAIHDHIRAAGAATRRSLEHGIAAGALLIEAKDLVDHGQWLPWLTENCRVWGVGVRQAQTFMRLTRNRHKLDALKNEATAHLTITAAEALVGRPKPERPHGLPGQLDLLGGEEVSALPSALRGQALGDSIVDLEQARAIVGQLIAMARRGKKRSGLRTNVDVSTLRVIAASLAAGATAQRTIVHITCTWGPPQHPDQLLHDRMLITEHFL